MGIIYQKDKRTGITYAYESMALQKKSFLRMDVGGNEALITIRHLTKVRICLRRLKS